MQNRFRSKTAWVSILALLVFVLRTYLNVDMKEVDTLINLMLACATAIGVFNNPTDKERY